MRIFPFRGIRPSNQLAGHLISRPYKDYKKQELDAELSFNPYSFLQVLNPSPPSDTVLKSHSHFYSIKNKYDEFRNHSILIQDEQPSLYVYKKVSAEKTYLGVIANVSTEAYKENKIKKHEDTLDLRVDLFTDYLSTVGFNAEPVLMTYKDNDYLAQTLQKLTNRPPQQDFCTRDKIRHQLWQINSSKEIQSIIRCFNEITTLYIADGHHRSASNYRLSTRFKHRQSYNQFMTFLLPQSQLEIGMFSRLVRGLNHHSPDSILNKLGQFFHIDSYEPEKKILIKSDDIIMYLDGRFHLLAVRRSLLSDTTSLSLISTQLLYNHILKPILGITDLRKSDRLDYSDSKLSLLAMQQLIDRGLYHVGFSMLPLSINQITEIADSDLTLPPKSTYITPKLYSGLVIYDYNL